MSNIIENSTETDQIKEDWLPYYQFLEALRRTCVVNMWGAGVYLVEAFHIPEKLAKEILLNWITNYNILNQKYGWQ